MGARHYARIWGWATVMSKANEEASDPKGRLEAWVAKVGESQGPEKGSLKPDPRS